MIFEVLKKSVSDSGSQAGKMKMTKLFRGISRYFSTPPAVVPLPHRSLSNNRLLFSTLPSKSTVLSGAVPVQGNLLYPAITLSSAVKPMFPSLLQPRVVVYDGVCHLCHRGVKLVIKADKHRKIKFCCLQSMAAEPYLKLCGLDREDVLHRFLFVEGLHSYYQASTAALMVMSYLPFPYPVTSTLFVIPRPIRDAIYDFVAKRRYDWFGKSDDCLVLKEKELLERFIDRDEMMDRNGPEI